MADITYIPTWAGFLYLAVVLDLWSRRVVGWAMATHLRTELVLDALNMAIWQRGPREVVHHSDHRVVEAVADRSHRGTYSQLPAAPSEGDRGAPTRARQNLDGDLAPEPCISCPVDLSHSLRAERRRDLVRAETGAGLERHSA